jgi:hypothetical protein
MHGKFLGLHDPDPQLFVHIWILPSTSKKFLKNLDFNFLSDFKTDVIVPTVSAVISKKKLIFVGILNFKATYELNWNFWIRRRRSFCGAWTTTSSGS